MSRPRILCPACKRDVSLSALEHVYGLGLEGAVARHKRTLTEWCPVSGRRLLLRAHPVPDPTP